jgi:glycosyltransferase involved in cell wall biosynthesis
LLRELRRESFDLLYVNSLWSPSFTVLPVLLTRVGLIRAKCILLAPRGELSPAALAIKQKKKRLFLVWWGRLLKGMTLTWHASTSQEASNIRSVFAWADAMVVPVQVGLPRTTVPPVAGGTSEAHFVFVSRIAAMKNLHTVLASLRNVKKAIKFDIYGPIEDVQYWNRCLSIIESLPAEIEVAYRGELSPGDVRPTFARYDAFVFPTLGESFGHVIAESLSASCPVICSDQTPWTSVLAAGGGSVVRNPTPARLGEEIGRIADRNASERLAARESAGRAYQAWRNNLPDLNVIEAARRAHHEALG